MPDAFLLVSRSTTKASSELTLALDELDDLNRGLGDVGHVLSVRKFTEERRGTNDDINTVDTCRAVSVKFSPVRA